MREPASASIGKKYRFLYVKDVYIKQFKTYKTNIAKCICDCGKETDILLGSIRLGRQISCGCYLKNRISPKLKHGKTNSRIYSIWHGMKDRCNNPTSDNYKNYGGRGIGVCEQWLDSFETFMFDMGEPLDGMTLDRIDNSKGYYKENCRWATKKQQGRNRRTNRLFTINGETKPLIEWCEQFDIKFSTVLRRLDGFGWDINTALTKKVRGN